MPLNLYRIIFSDYLYSPIIEKQIKASIQLIEKETKRIFFIGNGGSNAICSHMMEDFAKIANYPTFSFSDSALITCFSNDYGYENAIKEWIKIHYMTGDLLIAISSSGESKNILHAVDFVKSKNGNVITLTGFSDNNTLRKKGNINFHIKANNYGVVECFHQVILHITLDSINRNAYR